MAGVRDQMTICGSAGGRNTGRFVVRCGFIERPNQRTSIRSRNGRAIEPIDTLNGRRNGRDRPLVVGRVRNRETSDLARRVVSCDDLITWLAPAVVAVRVLAGISADHRRPPARGRRRQRIELDELSRGLVAAGWHGEGHRRLTLRFVEREAGGIESQRAERGRCPTGGVRQRAQRTKHRIALVLVQPAALLHERGSGRCAEQIGDLDAPARTQIDDPALAGAPGILVGGLEVDVVLI